MNKMKQTLREAILIAAQECGSDGLGKDGLVGFLKGIAIKYPRTYTGLIRALIPLQVNLEDNSDLVFRTTQELREALAERGLPIPEMMMDEVIAPPGTHFN